MILVRDAIKQLNLTFDQFYQRAINSKKDYPKLRKVDNRLYVDEVELKHLLVVSKIINEYYLPVTYCSKKIFGDSYALMRYEFKGLHLFPITEFFGKKYIRKDIFDNFYHEKCGNKKLVTFSRIKKLLLGIPDSKIYLILESTGMIDKAVFVLKSGERSRRFYKLSDVQAWCDSMNIKKIYNQY